MDPLAPPVMLFRGLLLAAVLAAAALPARAIPAFTREFGVSCQTCHSLPPRLNRFGEAFLANQYNWPGGAEPRGNGRFRDLPASLVSRFSYEDRGGQESTKGRPARAIVASGLRTGTGRGGFLLTFAPADAGTTRAGDIGEGYLTLPIERRGRWTLTAGQTTPLTTLWWHHTQISETPPLALSLARVRSSPPSAARPGIVRENGTHHAPPGPAAIATGPDFSFAEHFPQLRLEYFSGRGGYSTDGVYATLGVPFAGTLALNDRARLGGSRGVFGTLIRRRGASAVGSLGYLNGTDRMLGLILARDLRPNVQVLGIAALTDSHHGASHRLSLQGDYIVSPRLGLTARVDMAGGAEGAAGWVAGVSFYPFKLPVLRLTLEASEIAGSRRLELGARTQF